MFVQKYVDGVCVFISELYMEFPGPHVCLFAKSTLSVAHLSLVLIITLLYALLAFACLMTFVKSY